MFRLPASAIQVKVHGEADKIFVPQEKDIANRDDCTSMNIIDFGPSASNLSAAGIKSVVDPLAETVATGPASHVLRNRTDAVATKPTHQANPELPERNDSPDWGNSRQIFRVDMGSGALKPEDPLEVALTTPAITERPPPSMASTTPYAEQRTGSDITTGESSAKEVVSAMKCKTLLFCPLCADVILPQRFGSHFKEVLIAHMSGFSIFLSLISIPYYINAVPRN